MVQIGEKNISKDCICSDSDRDLITIRFHLVVLNHFAGFEYF